MTLKKFSRVYVSLIFTKHNMDIEMMLKKTVPYTAKNSDSDQCQTLSFE